MAFRFTALILLVTVIIFLASMAYLTRMPGKSNRGIVYELTETELRMRERLRGHVVMLAEEIGGRSAGRYTNLRRAAEYIRAELDSFGYKTRRQTYQLEGLEFENLEAELRGLARPDENVIVGAHYDTAGGLPGANDNATGVAATLDLAREYASQPLNLTVRWLFFVNEEPPYFQTPAMGSYVYAKECRDRGRRIAAMLSLETIGYYSDKPGSQTYPTGLHPGFPDRGDFLGFVANVHSARLLRRVVKIFRLHTSLPTEGAAAPAQIPGVGWSDHWSFWQFGYPAVMATDTAPYRYPYYHTSEDTPDKINYDQLARAVTGISAVIADLASH
jgi:Peptidase family M28